MAFPGDQHDNSDASPPPVLNLTVNRPLSLTNLPAPPSASSPSPAPADRLAGLVALDAPNSAFNMLGQDLTIHNYPSPGRTSSLIVHLMLQHSICRPYSTHYKWRRPNAATYFILCFRRLAYCLECRSRYDYQK
jgi:hypothetical protein